MNVKLTALAHSVLKTTLIGQGYYYHHLHLANKGTET